MLQVIMFVHLKLPAVTFPPLIPNITNRAMQSP